MGGFLVFVGEIFSSNADVLFRTVDACGRLGQVTRPRFRLTVLRVETNPLRFFSGLQAFLLPFFNLPFPF
jgi:hypothetical protein